MFGFTNPLLLTIFALQDVLNRALVLLSHPISLISKVNHIGLSSKKLWLSLLCSDKTNALQLIFWLPMVGANKKTDIFDITRCKTARSIKNILTARDIHWELREKKTVYIRYLTII